MIFKIQIIDDDKPITDAFVQMQEDNFVGRIHTMHHIGEGYYTCKTFAESGKIVIDGYSYGTYSHNETVFK